MPYIPRASRKRFDGPLAAILNRARESGLNVGELNYLVSTLCNGFLFNQSTVNYAALNDVVGVLECAKLEAYRRVAAPYEDKKLEANGDVYRAELV